MIGVSFFSRLEFRENIRSFDESEVLVRGGGDVEEAGGLVGDDFFEDVACLTSVGKVF